MFRHSRFVFLCITLLLVLLVSMTRPMAVYADDSTPPPPATEEATEPPPSAAEEPVATSPASFEAADAAVSEILETVPEGTAVVVLDETGEALPLASEDAAVIIAAVDPVWCPVISGVPLLPGDVGCSKNFTNSEALINNMDASNPATTNSVYEQDGIIYFTADPGGRFILIAGGQDDPAQNSELFLNDYNALKLYNLTLQGGWNGNTGVDFALNGQTTFNNRRVQIGSVDNPWAGNITVNNFTINNLSNTGLQMFTAGDIHLNQVVSENNTNGARLENTAGTGSVTIQDSIFSHNRRDGLRVTSNGSVSLNGITTETNGQRGVTVDTFGNITLLDVIADDNGTEGARLDNCQEDNSSNCTGYGTISVNAGSEGASSFSGNGVDGLAAYSFSNITVANVYANNNAELGGSLVNELGEGDIEVSNSTFDDNNTAVGTNAGKIAGLEVLTSGDVTLSDISASGNQVGDGAYMDGFGSLTIENSIFDGNQSGGDGVFAGGEDAEIVCSQFSNNRGYGINGVLGLLLTLDDVVFSGNLAGDYTGSATVISGGCEQGAGGEGGEDEGEEGGESEEEEGEEGGGSLPELIPVTSLPINFIQVAGSEQVDLNCEVYSGTKLVLPNGDSVVLPCPIRDEAVLTGKQQANLPGALAEPYGFISALDAEVIRDGKNVNSVNGMLTVDFVIPGDQQGAALTILHWDGTHWVEVPGGYDVNGARFAAVTNFTGIFVLVSK